MDLQWFDADLRTRSTRSGVKFGVGAATRRWRDLLSESRPWSQPMRVLVGRAARTSSGVSISPTTSTSMMRRGCHPRDWRGVNDSSGLPRGLRYQSCPSPLRSTQTTAFGVMLMPQPPCRVHRDRASGASPLF
jgi:hypothetical protein